MLVSEVIKCHSVCSQSQHFKHVAMPSLCCDIVGRPTVPAAAYNDDKFYVFIYNSTHLPINRFRIWWRTQSPVRDWGQPTRVCHQSDDTEDKTINGSAFLLGRAFDNSAHDTDVMFAGNIFHNMHVYVFISTYCSISRGKLPISCKQNWLQWSS